MEIGKYSKNRFLRVANSWGVPKDYVDCIYNYLIHGLEPGSFFSAVLANDFFSAMIHSHPGNMVAALKNLTNWIYNLKGEKVFWGSYTVVKKWTKLSATVRRKKLEELGIIFSEQDEILMILKNEPCQEPFFYS